MTPLKNLVGQIANEHLSIPTLECRNSDDLDFHTVSVWTVEAALTTAFEAGRTSTESDPVDIEAILAKRDQIAVIWSVEDVQEIRPDLTLEQAWEVLQRTSSKHDANVGITWETLDHQAQSLFGDAPEAHEA